MAQYIKQGDIFGRIGTGLGKGLADQVPKEMERNRLSSGLKAFEEDHQNLNPMQQLARLSAIPGITPQTIQSFSELARTNNQANAYRNLGGYKPNQRGQVPPPTASTKITPEQAANYGIPMQQGFNPQTESNPQGMRNSQMSPGAQQAPQKGQQAFHPGREAPENLNENTFNPAAKTRLPWTPEKRDASVVDYIDKGFLPDKAQQMAADDEARELGQAPVLQQRQREDQERTVAANNELDRQLETKFQKKGDEVNKDLIGEMKINLQREMNRFLRTHPNLSIEDAAHEFSNRALSTAKAKNQLDRLAKTTGPESFTKGDQTLKKLNSYSDIFKESGNSEELSNILRKNRDEGGLGLSPQGAAKIAFPLNNRAQKYVQDFKPDYSRFKGDRIVVGANLPDQRKINATARKAATDIGKFITSDDSLLSLARSFSEKDPLFNQEAFFDQLNEDQDQLPLNERQRRELAEGVEDILPTWGDLLIFPWFRGTK